MDIVDRSVAKLKTAEVAQVVVQSEIGPFYILTCEHGLMYAGWELSDEMAAWAAAHASGARAKAYAEQVGKELEAYFAGQLQTFSVPLVYDGTPFQKAVWTALCEIPYGETWSYRDLAVHIGRPLAVRAVGQANRANRIAVVIPCHRVIGADGKLVGYAGSATDLKAQLLALEQPSPLVGRQAANLVGQ